jgi:hypothetical protein
MAAPYGSLEKLPSSPADGLTVASNFFLSSLSLLALPAHAHGRRGDGASICNYKRRRL